MRNPVASDEAFDAEERSSLVSTGRTGREAGSSSVPPTASAMEITTAALTALDGCATAPPAAIKPSAEPVNINARISCSHSNLGK
jgi:hypothetical protein